MSMKMIHGNCLSVMSEMAENSVDLVFCDPPSGQTARCKWDKPLDLAELWDCYNRVVKEDGAILLMGTQPYTSHIVVSNLKDFKYEWIWEKPHGKGHLNAKIQPMRSHESILVFYKKQPTYNPIMTKGERKTVTRKRVVSSDVYGKDDAQVQYDSDSRYPRTVQVFSQDTQKSKLHQSQKPVSLISYFIQTYSNPNDLVLDNCMGSASTAIAAIKTGRSFVGIESDELIFETAKSRVDQELQQMSLFGSLA